MTKKGALSAHFTAVKLLITFVIGVCFSVTAFSQTSRLSTRRNADPDLTSSGYLYQSKPFREENKQFSMMGAELSYRLENSLRHNTVLSFGAGYIHTWTEFQDKSTSYLDEISFSASRTSAHSKVSSLTYGVSLNAPANDADQKARFNGSLNLPIGVGWKVVNHTFGVKAEPTFYSYGYDTANEAGTEYNKKMSLLVQAGWKWAFTDSAFLRSSVGTFEYLNYANKSYQIYTLNSMLGYAFNKNLTVVGGIASKDRVVTTNSVLADDVTALRAGMEWSL